MNNISHEKPKWYFRTRTLIVGFFLIGPFVLPLVWFNKKYTFIQKIVISAIILVISGFLFKFIFDSVQNLGSYV
ncbi:hypothetical protein MNBD_UNCLBAC01-2005 [hydrothermal vent metagenome]|uniref:Uncharacterized protein n=1 Tax=hydrothermal vent metagenome TaxID=652676 RepID=A0A3B1CZB8_9ZZZZ